jgi:hypothetical protein
MEMLHLMHASKIQLFEDILKFNTPGVNFNMYGVISMILYTCGSQTMGCNPKLSHGQYPSELQIFYQFFIFR